MRPASLSNLALARAYAADPHNPAIRAAYQKRLDAYRLPAEPRGHQPERFTDDR
jgi:hypothetical protein